MFGQIRDFIIANKQKSELQPMHIQCSNCNHQYDQPFTLNMTDFFAGAS
jgi:hypothetical protein